MLFIELVVALFDHKYVNGAVPPVALTDAVPVGLQVEGVDEVVRINGLGCEIVAAAFIIHPLASVMCTE
jgi:hypothetical protein